MNNLDINKRDIQNYFFFRVLIFLFLLIISDLIIGMLLKKMYNQQSSGWLYRSSYALDSTKADILIFGASRANHHYYSRLFAQELNLSSYNTGRDGNAIFYHYAVLQSVLKRYHPKVAILDFSHAEFLKSADSYERISSLLPYYYSHVELQPIIQLKSNFEHLKLLSSIYPYNSLLFQIIAGNSKYNTSRDNRADDLGYVPLHKMFKGVTVNNASYGNYDLDQLKINYFKKFINDCASARIKLYIILSPCFLKFNVNDASVVIAKKLSIDNKIPFLDFSSEPVFLENPTIYADESHLNDTGAKIFTKMVIDKIKDDFIPFTSQQNHLASSK